MIVTKNCIHKDCTAAIDINVPEGDTIDKDFKFICRKHTPKPRDRFRFQRVQHDKLLTPAGRYIPAGFQPVIPYQEVIDIPDWAKSDEGLKEVLLSAFPKAETDEKQAVSAGRWMRVLYLYYRMRFSVDDIAEEMQIPVETVRNITRRAKRVGRGEPANGVKRP